MKITDNKLTQQHIRALVKIVEQTGVFDKAHYRKQLDGSAKKHNNLISHYLNEGWKAGLNPHPCFSTVYYLENNKDVADLKMNPFLHFIFYGWKEDRFTSEQFSLTDYRRQHPEIVASGINPLRHFSENYGGPGIGQGLINTQKGIDSLLTNDEDQVSLMTQAIAAGLFDPEWYKATYNGNFNDDLSAFRDYLRKSVFSTVNPSAAFDTETYHRQNNDVYHAQISPLTHFLLRGRDEGRACPSPTPKWGPATHIDAKRWLASGVGGLKIAICLHIFYEDYIERFAQSLKGFPVQIDIFVTVIDANLEHRINEAYAQIENVGKVVVRTVPNRGRNFGPLLTEFGNELKAYDLFCHLHSKKSLYSGREQHQWASYLTEYLINDKSLVIQILNAFFADSKLGMYYPTTFWMMPSWVNHLTMNKAFVKQWYQQLGIAPKLEDFLCYPAGGMFWARPAALGRLLELSYTYDDFPNEPLPNDGSTLHGLERAIGPLVEENGYHQFFYHPGSAKLTTDKSHITQNYNLSLATFQDRLRQFSHVSFDVFDTLVRRKFTVPDYAKFLLGKEMTVAGLVSSPHEFVALRNRTEYDIRKSHDFNGDVCIDSIYCEVAKLLGISRAESECLMQREFELDLDMLLPKNEVVDIFNSLGTTGHVLWVISDTYYKASQVSLILKKAGVTAPYRLIVSSQELKRKDNGTMWAMVKKDLIQEGVVNHIHVGDNVVADSQIPGDLGIQTMHILHPMDKWRALGFPSVLDGDAMPDEHEILKWGGLISSVGRYPYLAE